MHILQETALGLRKLSVVQKYDPPIELSKEDYTGKHACSEANPPLKAHHCLANDAGDRILARQVLWYDPSILRSSC